MRRAQTERGQQLIVGQDEIDDDRRGAPRRSISPRPDGPGHTRCGDGPARPGTATSRRARGRSGSRRGPGRCPADSTWKVTSPPQTVTSCSRGRRSRLAMAVASRRWPPAILPPGQRSRTCGMHLAREEAGVVQRQVLRHAADLEQDHQMADAQALDALAELLAHGGGAARDDVSLVDVLAPVERLARPSWPGRRTAVAVPTCKVLRVR